MKKLLFTLCIAFPFIVLGQGKGTWTISADFTPGISYRLLTGDDELSIISNRDDREEPVFGFSASARIAYEFKDNWTLQSGVQYLRIGYKYEQNDLVYGYQIDPRYGLIYPPFPSSIKDISVENRNEFLQIPILVGYNKKLSNRFSLTFAGGIENSFLLSDKELVSTTLYSGEKRDETNEASMSEKSFTLSGTIEISANYVLNEKWGVFAGIKGMMFILPINTDPIKEHSYWGGGKIGVSYRFNRPTENG